MPSYASFDVYVDQGYDVFSFLKNFFYEAECMVKTYEGLLFYLKDSLEKIEVQYVSKVFIGPDHIYFQFKQHSDQRDMVIMYNYIRKIEVLPNDPNRWG